MENDIPVEQFMEEIESDNDEQVIRKHRPHFGKEHIDKMREIGKSKRNIEQLKKMNEIRSAKKKEKDLQKAKEHLLNNGFDVSEKKNTEPPKIQETVPEPTKSDPVVEQNTPPEAKPAEQPKTPVPAPVVEKKQKDKKPKKKKRVEYIDDDYDEPEPPPRPLTRQRRITDRDVDEYLRNKLMAMNMEQLEQKMAKQVYDFKYQRELEDVIGRQMFGRY